MTLQKDFLFLHIRDLPYFRGFLRAIESRYYQDFDLPSPILDVGCGDGNFAALTFDQQIDVGLDPWHGPIHEASQYQKYRLLTEADGGRMPFPDGYFASALSNSVLEHIPQVQTVLNETARVLQPGAPFYFCVPNTNFTQNLSVARFFDRIGLKSSQPHIAGSSTIFRVTSIVTLPTFGKRAWPKRDSRSSAGGTTFLRPRWRRSSGDITSACPR